METIGIVQASFGSPRFRGIASRRFGGRPLLEWVVRRVTDSTQLDGVIVVAGGNVESEILHDLVPPDVPIFVDAKSDPLDRFAHALERYPAASAVRIHGDSPFVDAELIDRLVELALERKAERDRTKHEFRSDA